MPFSLCAKMIFFFLIYFMVSKIFKIAFLGSDQIALPFLEFLHFECPFIEISGILTQPDRRSGRGRKMSPNPIKEWAEINSISSRSPQKLSDIECDWIKDLKVDLILVMAYGHILKKSFLSIPPIGCFNLHASLLPKFRGASPIESSIAMGENFTGVTLMRIIPKMDAGPILDFEKVEIDYEDTGASMRLKIASSCVPLIRRNIEGLLDGSIEEKSQDDEKATYCRKLNKQDGNLDFSAASLELVNRIRAFKTWPGCFFLIGDQKIRIGSAEFEKNNNFLDIGSTTFDEDGNFLIGTSEGVLVPKELQKSGGKMLRTIDFFRGFQIPDELKISSFEMEPLILPR